MPRQLWIADALRNAGLKVIEQPGWRERGSTTFDPKGVVCHHTASKRTSGDTPSLNVVLKGRPDLPGPLCQVLIGRSGACHVIAAGRAQHAGTGGWKGLTGNASVLGIEAENDGIGEPWSPNLVDVFERCAAALARGCKAPAEMVCGHKEWTRRKIDPAGIDMHRFRSVVASLLNNAPSPLPKDFTMAGLNRDDALRGVVRQAFRANLLRTPGTQAELDNHVLHLAKVGYEVYVRDLIQSDEGQNVLARERKSVLGV